MSSLRSSWNRLLLVMTLFALPALPAQLFSQGATVTGHVTGEGGVPVPGVSVSITGMGLGSITGPDGVYSFTVPASRVTGQAVTLTARRVGYTPATRADHAQRRHGHSRFRDDRDGAAARAGHRHRRRHVASARAHRQHDQHRRHTAITRAAQPQNIISRARRQRRRTCASTRSRVSRAASAFVIIRGATSVTGTNQPLIVVDNQPIDNSTISTNGGDGSTVTQNRAADINPNDIESVADPEGCGGVRDLRRARRERRHPHHDEARRERADALHDHVDADLRQRRSRRSRCSSSSARAAAARRAPARRPTAARSSLTRGDRSSIAGTPTFDHGTEIYDTGLTSDNAISRLRRQRSARRSISPAG